jgi:hypothetical protein
MDKKSKNTRSRKYLLTINNPIEHGETHAEIMKKLSKFRYRYIAMCDETGNKGTYHTHVYVYYENAVCFSTIKGLFPSANIATVRGTSVQNREYLLKSAPEHNKKTDGSYEYKDSTGKIHMGVNHSETFEELGECPQEEQGKRSDLEYMYSLVKDGLTNSEILELIPETAIKHIDKINKLRLSYLVDKYKGQRRLDLQVHYITGKTGLGKSRDILDEFGDENVYRVTDYNHPFDSYQNESVLVFEEFRSSQKLSDMLNYLDVYPVILPARYTPKICCATKIFVVSNWDFEMQFSEIQKDPEQRSSYDAWVRRFNGYVKEYINKDTIITYPTMPDYLNRKKAFRPVDEPTPFDIDVEISQNEMPFD